MLQRVQVFYEKHFHHNDVQGELCILYRLMIMHDALVYRGNYQKDIVKHPWVSPPSDLQTKLLLSSTTMIQCPVNASTNFIMRYSKRIVVGVFPVPIGLS